MDQHRAVHRIADVLQDGQQMVEIVPVDGPDIVEAELFEHRSASPETTRILFRQARLFLQEFRQFLGKLLGGFAE